MVIYINNDYYRLFEVRGAHNEYKVPEIKSTDIHKKTKATINRLQAISHDNESFIRERGKYSFIL